MYKMKSVLIIFLCLIFSGIAEAQILNPVGWTVTSKRIKGNVYEVHLKATIKNGWHIYSQYTPEGGPLPTSVAFTKNPLFDLDGKTKEKGKLEQHHEELFGVDVKQFSNSVDFVQLIKLKAAVKTAANVVVEYTVCNDKQCLPPASKSFTIALNN